MACTTRIKGYGIVGCNNPVSNNQFYDLTYSGIWTLGTRPNCGATQSPISPAGVIHPAHNFSSVVSIEYIDCGPPPGSKYDCVNGNCVISTTYNTPGIYNSLTICQSSCATNSTPCDGECVPTAEIQQLQAAANTVKSRLCS